MAMGWDDLLKILIPIIAGGASSAFAPSPYQPRNSFAGTAADPRSTLAEAQSYLRSIIPGVADWAMGPVELTGSMPKRLPSFSGGGLPMPIGLGDTPEQYTTPGSLGPIRRPTVAQPNPPGMGENYVDANVGGHSNPPGGGPNLPGNAPADEDGSNGKQPKSYSVAGVAGAGDPTSTGLTPSGASGMVPPTMDPQTSGALQLLMHLTQQRQQPATSRGMAA